MKDKIEKLETTVREDLKQINTFRAREELESLNKKGNEWLEKMAQLLSLGEEHLEVTKGIRDLQHEQVQLDKAAAGERWLDKEKECHQLFRLTNGTNDATYEWYKDRVEDRVDGTCQWFLQHEHFRHWLKQDSGPLLVSADPGCGKSVLAKFLIDQVLPQSASDTTNICYFFFKDQDQNTLNQALCAILHQLFSHNHSLIQHAMQAYGEDGSNLINVTTKLWDILRKSVQDPRAGSVIIVLDALDECAESEAEELLKRLQRQFRNGQSSDGRLKYLLTSRPYEQISFRVRELADTFPNFHIPGQEHSDDISREVDLVITHRADQLARQKELSDQVKETLLQKLRGIQHRTYLWVYLLFDFLKTEHFRKTSLGIESAIATLPQNVNQAYEKILNKQPLTVAEMNCAMSTDDNLDIEQEEDFKSSLRAWFGLFVSIYHGKVYLLHQTAREFLLARDPPPSSCGWQASITSCDAHRVLAETCVAYLDCFNQDDSLSTDADPRCAFLNYSALNWGHHVYEVCLSNDKNAALVSSILKICTSDSQSYAAWGPVFGRSLGIQDHSSLTALIIASYFGHEAVVQQLL
ncbi:hypothetical protein M406DRAFT_53006, partial [Cryphonectria parasitica EP155]